MATDKLISLEEVGKHNKEDDVWIVLYGRVLNCTSFLSQHPGGKEQIMKYAGKDATKVWDMLHKVEFINEYIPSECQMGFTTQEALEENMGRDVIVEDVPEGRRMLLVGHGPVGNCFIESLIKQQEKNLPHSAGKYHVTVFCEEQWPAYDRVGMTQYFTDRSVKKLNITDQKLYRDNGIVIRLNERVDDIDRANKKVRTQNGEWFEYDKLILSTGSYAFVPPIKNLKIDIAGVFEYRYIGDMEGMIEYSSKCKNAAVLGGGLLGLEAAKAVLDLNVPTSVLEVAPWLMPMQLDHQGGKCLEQMIVALGLTVHTSIKVNHIVAEGGVLKGIDVTLSNGKTQVLPLEMLVVSCGVRPRDELAKQAGLELGPRGGVKIDNFCRTSDPSIYSVGEVASHNGRCYGLVAPGFEQARTLVNHLICELNPSVAPVEYLGSDLSTKLKLMGVDVASFGKSDDFWMEKWYDDKNDVVNGGRFVFLRQHDPFSGYYRKLLFTPDEQTLLGGICIGDASDYQVLLNLTKKGLQGKSAKELFMGGGALEIDASALDDSDVVCTCQGVTKGMVCEAIEEQEIETMEVLKQATKCGQGCGGCVLTTGFVPKIFKQKLEELGKEAFEGICVHFPFSRAELYEIIVVKDLRTYQDIIEVAGNKDQDKAGCEQCKPAVASILASVFNDHVMKPEHHTIQDTNDYVLANIQRSGQYSVIPRVPGGEVSPEEMMLLSLVAKKYGLWTKITGAQRIGLFGANIYDLPKIYADIGSGVINGRTICPGGMETGQAYGKALRAVKSCVGSSWCRFGQQDSVAFAVRLEQRYKGLRTPHKLKGGVSGCLRECAEARGKDFGAIATPNGYNLYVCGNHGASPRHGVLIASDINEDRVIQLLDRVLIYYVRTAPPLIRMSKWLEDMEGGMQHLKAVVIDDKLGICEDLERQMQRHVDSFFDEWRTIVENPQLQKRFKQFVNVEEGNNGDLKWVDEKYDPRQKQKKIINIDHPAIVGPASVTKEDKDETWSWVFAGKVEDFPLNGGGAILLGKSQLAVFRHAATNKWFATQNMCPHKQLNVLSRGLIGIENNRPKVVCPIHKNRYRLDDGTGITNQGFNLATFDVKVQNQEVFVLVPPLDVLDKLIGQKDPQLGPDPPGCGGACGDGGGLADLEDLVPQPVAQVKSVL